MPEIQHVKAFDGSLIPRDKARKIDGQFYEEGVSCILMPDGQWYRVITDKIRFDWEKRVWLFARDSEHLFKGLVDDGSIGYFTPSDENVKISYRKDAFVRKVKLDVFAQNDPEEIVETKNSWIRSEARNQEIAEKYGFVEAISDGIFYKDTDLKEVERIQLQKPSTPNNERTNTYSLEDHQNKKAMVDVYNKYTPNIPLGIRRMAAFVPYSFGGEFETHIGFVPARLRSKLGVCPLRDGSIGGIEYVTIPLEGAKGINTIKELCDELSKRAQTNLQCSVHFHFGNVRRDKLYILSLWSLGEKIQDELLSIFPYSRVNSIRPDGKVYCKPLPDLSMSCEEIFKAKSKEQFQKQIITEFNKIYAFLNNDNKVGDIKEIKRVKKEKLTLLAGKQTKVWRLETKNYCFSTKVKNHAIRGHKWDRPQRYYWMNLLPTFFSNAETIEFRPHEACINFERSIMWLLICVAILEYAKNIKTCILEKNITLRTVIESYYPAKVSAHLLGYCEKRFKTFHREDGNYRSSWDVIETKWLAEDKNFKFNNISIIDLW